MNKLFSLLILLVLSLDVLAQQADMSLVPYRQGNKWGYASPDKKLIIQPQYDEANWFYSGYASVKKAGKFGYINTAGKLVIPYRFTVAKPFRYGYISKPGKAKEDTVLFAGASLQASGYEICIDTKGTRMLKCPAINENTDAGNRQAPTVTQQKTYSISNDSLFDKILDDYRIPGYGDTYYIATKNGQYGVFNNKFEIAVPFQYSNIKKLDLGDKIYLEVEKNGMNGLYNSNGSVLINTDNNKITHVKARDGKDYFITSKDGVAAVTDADHHALLSPEYADISYDNAGFVLTGSGNLKGFYFLNTQLVAPKYSAVKSVNGGKYLLVTTASGKTGYVGMDGQEYFTD
ncbi:MAG: WG repeat-containing protein [Ferruginibacter sp.]